MRKDLYDLSIRAFARDCDSWELDLKPGASLSRYLVWTLARSSDEMDEESADFFLRSLAVIRENEMAFEFMVWAFVSGEREVRDAKDGTYIRLRGTGQPNSRRWREWRERIQFDLSVVDQTPLPELADLAIELVDMSNVFERRAYSEAFRRLGRSLNESVYFGMWDQLHMKASDVARAAIAEYRGDDMDTLIQALERFGPFGGGPGRSRSETV